MAKIDAQKALRKYLSLWFTIIAIAFLSILFWLCQNYDFYTLRFWLVALVEIFLLIMAIRLHLAIMRIIKNIRDA